MLIVLYCLVSKLHQYKHKFASCCDTNWIILQFSQVQQSLHVKKKVAFDIKIGGLFKKQGINSDTERHQK